MGNLNDNKRDIKSPFKGKKIKKTFKDEYNENFVKEISNMKLFRKNSKNMEGTLTLETSLKNHFLFSDLDEKIIQEMVSDIPLYQVDSKVKIIQEGTYSDYFYIIEEGAFEVSQNNIFLKTLNDGECFGDISLLFKCPRTATITCVKKSYVYVLNREEFLGIVKHLSNKNSDEFMSYLNNTKYSNFLDSTIKAHMISYMIKLSYKPGQLIIKEGDVSNSVFLIKDGEVEVKSKEKSIRILKKNDFFGEYSILIDSLRTKTCIAKTKTVLYAIPKRDIFELDDNIKDFINDLHIKMIIQNSEIFRKLNMKILNNFKGIFSNKKFSKGEIVLNEDYDLSSKIIFVLNGTLVNYKTKEIFCNKGQIVAEQAISKQTSDIVGETIIADPDCYICQAYVNDFIKLTGFSFTDLLDKAEMLNQLKIIPLFRSLSSHKLESIVNKIRIEHFCLGQNIIVQGEEGTKLYIIKKGKADIEVNGKKVRTLGENENFGERALFFKEPRSATVVAASDLVELLSLENDDFKLLLETNLKEYLINRLVLQDNKVQLKDLEVIKELHRGEYSAVYLIKNKMTKYLYVLKRFPVEVIYSENLDKQVFNEKNILLQLDNPFIVRIVKALNDSNNVYYLLEYIKGMKLSEALFEIGLLNKNQTQFYLASILLFLDFLHSRKFVHRDIRPENIYLAENGYIKILDLSTAREVKDKCTTLIGNPYYMAPEVILGEGYYFSCDFWSAGICAYEFHCGTIPFGDNADDPMQIYLAIINQ